MKKSQLLFLMPVVLGGALLLVCFLLRTDRQATERFQPVAIEKAAPPAPFGPLISGSPGLSEPSKEAYVVIANHLASYGGWNPIEYRRLSQLGLEGLIEELKAWPKRSSTEPQTDLHLLLQFLECCIQLRALDGSYMHDNWSPFLSEGEKKALRTIARHLAEAGADDGIRLLYRLKEAEDYGFFLTLVRRMTIPEPLQALIDLDRRKAKAEVRQVLENAHLDHSNESLRRVALGAAVRYPEFYFDAVPLVAEMWRLNQLNHEAVSDGIAILVSERAQNPQAERLLREVMQDLEWVGDSAHRHSAMEAFDPSQQAAMIIEELGKASVSRSHAILSYVQRTFDINEINSSNTVRAPIVSFLKNHLMDVRIHSPDESEWTRADIIAQRLRTIALLSGPQEIPYLAAYLQNGDNDLVRQVVDILRIFMGSDNAESTTKEEIRGLLTPLLNHPDVVIQENVVDLLRN